MGPWSGFTHFKCGYSQSALPTMSPERLALTRVLALALASFGCSKSGVEWAKRRRRGARSTAARHRRPVADGRDACALRASFGAFSGVEGRRTKGATVVDGASGAGGEGDRCRRAARRHSRPRQRPLRRHGPRDPYKTFVHRFFPNARVVADKFHVLRLLIPHINRRRKLITGDRRSAVIRRLLLRSRFALDHGSRFAVDTWLASYPICTRCTRPRRRCTGCIESADATEPPSC